MRPTETPERGQGRRVTITLTEHEKDVLDALTFLGETVGTSYSTGRRVHDALWSYLQGRFRDDPQVRQLVQARRSYRERQAIDREFAAIVAGVEADRG
jgi:hypothetical protein